MGQTVVFKTLIPWLDSYTYVSCADHMLTHGWKEKLVYEEFFPWKTQVQWYQDWGLRVGGQQLMAFLTAVVKNELSFASLVPCLAVGSMLTGCGLLRFTTCILDRYMAKEKRFVAEVVVCLFAALNGFLFVDPFQGFYPMTLGSAFFLLTVSEIILGLSETYEKGSVLWGTIYACCTAITYSEILPFLALQVICLLVYKVFTDKKVLNQFTKYIIKIALFSILFLNIYVLDAIKAIIMEMQDAVGSPREYGIFEYTGYIIGTLPSLYSFHMGEAVIQKLFFLLITGVFGFGIVLMFKKYINKKEMLKHIGLLCLPFVVLLFYFSFFARNLWEDGTGNSYSVYKTVRYFSLLILPLIAIAVNQFYYSERNLRRFWVYIYIVMISLIGIYNVVSQYSYARSGVAQLLGKEDKNFESYYQLRERLRGEERVINLVGLPEAHARLISYFLKECKVAWPYRNDIFHWRYVDADPPYAEDGLTYIYKPNEESIAGLVEYPKGYCELILRDGFYQEERLQDEERICWSKRQSVLTVTRPIDIEEEVDVNFQIYLNIPCQESNIKIYDNASGELLRTINTYTDDLEPITIQFTLEMENLLERDLKLEFEGAAYEGERELAFLVLLDENIRHESDVY